MKKLLLLLLTIISINIYSQNIGGIINKYANVVEIDYCQNSVSIPSLLGSQFNTGDKILIIQMKGADLKEGNNINNGKIDEYNNAGNYEINEIRSINSGANVDIVLKYELEREYNVDGFIQIVTIPQYTDVTITNTLTCQAWDGSFGGILVFNATGTVTMNANIDVSGKGFRGGEAENLANQCWSSIGYSGYNCEYASDCGAKKGEGIGNRYEILDLGRAVNANGGGGGNDHNGSGGGGGAFGKGGKGGFHVGGCVGEGGDGGLILDYSSLNKIFFTGGGGAGDGNSLGIGGGTDGASSGGLVYITSNSIIQNGYKIIANGNDVIDVANHDGAGGGGAAGIVVLDIENYNPINIELNGGKGGDIFASGGCQGTGGGGSGGIVWLSQANAVTDINLVAQGGSVGIVSGCTIDTLGSEPGENGGFYYNFKRFESETYFEPINLIAGNDTILCGAAGVPLWADISTTKDYDFIWTWSSGSETEEDFIFNPEYSGNYNVTATASFDKFDVHCEEIHIVHVGINKPHISIVASSFFGDTVKIGDVFFLNALITPSSENYTYTWTPKDRIEPNNERNTIATPYKTGEYCLTVEDEDGCNNTECVTLYVYDPEILSPDAFTPNNDDLNNSFFPIITDDLKVVSFKIYDRWGDLVYKTSEKIAWNGKKDGVDLPSDLYIWHLKVIQDLSEKTFNKIGNISIVR